MTILYPLLLAKTRIQASRKDTQPGTRSMHDVWDSALRRQGPAGLYQGLEAQLLKGFLNQGLTMMIKQRCRILPLCYSHHHSESYACLYIHRIEQWIVALYLYRIRKITKPMLYRYVYAIFYVE